MAHLDDSLRTQGLAVFISVYSFLRDYVYELSDELSDRVWFRPLLINPETRISVSVSVCHCLEGATRSVALSCRGGGIAHEASRWRA